MQKNNFSVRIVPGENFHSNYIPLERSNHEVEMLNGMTYGIEITNQHSVRANLKLWIDGNHIGSFNMDAFDKDVLYRSPKSPKCFTFFELRSEEGESALDDNEDLGLITAKLTPELIRKPSFQVEGSRGVTRGGSKGVAGGTALTGHSQQQFSTGSALELDYSKETVFNLRLIGVNKTVKTQVQSLKSLNDIPPRRGKY